MTLVDEFIFDKDIFLLTKYPTARESRDRNNPDGSGSVNDFTDGMGFAVDLMEQFPGRRSLIDLGTATGTVPMTMRKAGMLAVGLEGSEAPKIRGLGCWSEMPGIVRTCDIGKPFQICDADGKLVIFDFVTAWDVIEHIPEGDIRQLLATVETLMGPDSILILEFSLAYNPLDGYHQLWENWENGAYEDGSWEARDIWFRELVSTHFVIDERLKNLWNWNYCRPNDQERQYSRDNGLEEFPFSRPLWWLRKKR